MVLTQAFHEHAAVERMIPTSQVTRWWRWLNTWTQWQLKTLGKSHVVAVVDQTVNVSTAQLILSKKNASITRVINTSCTYLTFICQKNIDMQKIQHQPDWLVLRVTFNTESQLNYKDSIYVFKKIIERMNMNLKALITLCLKKRTLFLFLL